MNPYGHVVSENVDGIITVNGHSYTDPAYWKWKYEFCDFSQQSFYKAL